MINDITNRKFLFFHVLLALLIFAVDFSFLQIIVWSSFIALIGNIKRDLLNNQSGINIKKILKLLILLIIAGVVAVGLYWIFIIKHSKHAPNSEFWLFLFIFPTIAFLLQWLYFSLYHRFHKSIPTSIEKYPHTIAPWILGNLGLFFFIIILSEIFSESFTIKQIIPAYHFVKYLFSLFVLPFLLHWILIIMESFLVQRENVLIFFWLSLSAIGTAMSFPQADLIFFRGNAFTAWFFLIPLFYYVLQKRNQFKEMIYIIYIWEMVFTIFTLYWLKDFADLGVVFLALVLPLYRSFPMAFSVYLTRNLSRNFLVFLVPMGFMFSDVFRSYGFLAFPWNFIGYSQVHWPEMLYFSRYGGVWLVTFLVLANNFFLAQIFLNGMDEKKQSILKESFSTSVQYFINFLIQQIKNKYLNISKVYFLFILVLMGMIFAHTRKIEKIVQMKSNMREKRNVVIVQPVFDPWASWRKNRMQYLKILTYLTEQAVTPENDFILWTESSTLERFSIYEKYNRSDPFQDEVKKLIKKLQKPLITGSIDTVPYSDQGRINYKEYNAVTLFDGNAKISSTYRKNQLVPFGEWFPYDKLLPGIRSILDSYGASTWDPGEFLSIMHLPITGQFGPLICYEGIFSRLVRQYVNMGANYLVNLTNLMWTKHYSGHLQHARIAQMRAMEQNRYFIRAANDGLSCIIDPYGRIIEEIPLYKPGFLRGQIDVASREKTLYAQWGDWFLFVMFFVLLSSGIYAYYLRRGK